jgi:hypothetical protein
MADHKAKIKPEAGVKARRTKLTNPEPQYAMPDIANRTTATPRNTTPGKTATLPQHPHKKQKPNENNTATSTHHSTNTPTDPTNDAVGTAAAPPVPNTSMTARKNGKPKKRQPKKPPPATLSPDTNMTATSDTEDTTSETTAHVTTHPNNNPYSPLAELDEEETDDPMEENAEARQLVAATAQTHAAGQPGPRTTLHSGCYMPALQAPEADPHGFLAALNGPANTQPQLFHTPTASTAPPPQGIPMPATPTALTAPPPQGMAMPVTYPTPFMAGLQPPPTEELIRQFYAFYYSKMAATNNPAQPYPPLPVTPHNLNDASPATAHQYMLPPTANLSEGPFLPVKPQAKRSYADAAMRAPKSPPPATKATKPPPPATLLSTNPNSQYEASITDGQRVRRLTVRYTHYAGENNTQLEHNIKQAVDEAIRQHSTKYPLGLQFHVHSVRWKKQLERNPGNTHTSPYNPHSPPPPPITEFALTVALNDNHPDTPNEAFEDQVNYFIRHQLYKHTPDQYTITQDGRYILNGSPPIQTPSTLAEASHISIYIPACNSHTEKARGVLGGPTLGHQESSPRAFKHLMERMRLHLVGHWDTDQANIGNDPEFHDHFGLRPAKLHHNKRHCQIIYIQASTDAHYQCLVQALERAPPFRYGGIRILAIPFPTSTRTKDTYITDVLNTYTRHQQLNPFRTTMLKPIALGDPQHEEDLLRSSHRLAAILYHFMDPAASEPQAHTLLFHPHSSTALLTEEAIRALLPATFLKPPQPVAPATPTYPTRGAGPVTPSPYHTPIAQLLQDYLIRPPSPPALAPPPPQLTAVPTHTATSELHQKRSRTDADLSAPYHGLTPDELYDPTLDTRTFVTRVYPIHHTQRHIPAFEAYRANVIGMPDLQPYYSHFIDLLLETIEQNQTPAYLGNRFTTFLTTQKHPASP